MARSRRRTGQKSPTWMASTQPGLGKAAAAELRDGGATVESVENDGRSDLVFFTGEDPSSLAPALAEDLYVVVGQTTKGGSVRAVVERLFDADRWRAGFDTAREHGARVGASTSFRVIARVRSERSFKRTELRNEAVERIAGWRPRWRPGDPADVELWVFETRLNNYRAAVRLPSSRQARGRGDRAVERFGALRPAIAAALVRAAGAPSGLLVDPFCGSGTILGEARGAGWKTAGFDVDPAAVEVARANLPGLEVSAGEATSLALADGAAAAVVTNAPFGAQHEPQTGDRPLGEWWREVFAEMARVVRAGGAVVVLHPGGRAFTDALRATQQLRQEQQSKIEVLGRPATVWVLRRRG